MPTALNDTSDEQNYFPVGGKKRKKRERRGKKKDTCVPMKDFFKRATTIREREKCRLLCSNREEAA